MLKAGTGKVDVSPEKPLFLVGYPHVERTSEGIHDPLFATAIYFGQGDKGILCVSVDVLYVSHKMVKKCRKRLEAETDLQAQNIMISATHTHSGPVTCDVLAWRDDPVVPEPDPEYLEVMADGVVEAGRRAVADARPAELAVTSADIDGVGCNRLDPEGTRDPEAGLIVVRDTTHKSIFGVQVFYSMHPTVLHEDTKLVSSDFPGFARETIEAWFPKASVIYHTGPCGNLSTRYHVREQTFAEAERLGTRLGQQICSALGSLQEGDYTDELALESAVGEAHLPPKKFPSVADAEKHLKDVRAKFERLKREDAERGKVRTAECEVFGAEERLTMARAQESGELRKIQEVYGRAEVQVFRIGDTAVVGFPGECFVEYALEVKSEAPCRVFVASLANGELQGYITTPGASGYEADLSLFKPKAGAKMVEKALDLLEDACGEGDTV